ncbi:MAG: group II intron reverse transcriptase/maturase [Phaeodactylibacter sp.]|nr:group II intron reverse transcriptase/maturase [Phaeodactylibacter sp.]
MRKAETVLSIIRERGKRKLPLNDLYRQLYNEELYLHAYGKLYRNKGAMTPGVTPDTVDGMSREKIKKLIELLRYERYRWNPVKRIYIPKKNGKQRPLGIPSWTDKLLQEVIRLLLEAYYEPQFSGQSHGFRPNRGCHTALIQIKKVWHGTKWFIEGDIRGFFDGICHSTMLNILGQSIRDNRFLRLIQNLLKAGYLEDWKYSPTEVGAPQGSIISPLLSNIYLNQLDQFVEEKLMPEYTKGKRRRDNPAYRKACDRSYYCRKTGKVEEAKKLEARYRELPANDPYDPEYRRLRYVRYADDFLLGFAGPKTEAEQIKARLKEYLNNELHLQLSEEKTLITHAATDKARFLGYGLTVSQCSTKITNRRRSINGGIALRVPPDVIKDKCRFYMRHNKPVHRKERTHNSDYDIICQYQSEYRGIVQYYQLGENLIWLHKLYWVMQNSLLKTLAHKYKMSVSKVARKYRATVDTPHGPRKCIEVQVERTGKPNLIARFGGIPLKHSLEALAVGQHNLMRKRFGRTELIQRLLAEKCEICGSTKNIEVHHIKKMANLKQKGRMPKADWMILMAARHRKTLVLCRKCHRKLHAGQPLPMKSKRVTGEP